MKSSGKWKYNSKTHRLDNKLVEVNVFFFFFSSSEKTNHNLRIVKLARFRWKQWQIMPLMPNSYASKMMFAERIPDVSIFLPSIVRFNDKMKTKHRTTDEIMLQIMTLFQMSTQNHSNNRIIQIPMTVQFSLQSLQSLFHPIINDLDVILHVIYNNCMWIYFLNNGNEMAGQKWHSSIWLRNFVFHMTKLQTNMYHERLPKMFVPLKCTIATAIWSDTFYKRVTHQSELWLV